MRNAIDRDGESSWRAGVVEAEEGDDPVDIYEQYGSLISHLGEGR